MRTLLCVLLFLFPLCCFAQLAEVNCETPWGETLGNTEINVGTNCHYGGGWPTWGWPACAAPFAIKDIISNPAYRIARFSAGFNGTAKYETDDPLNQNDWNKLVRIYSDACSNEQYYLTLGWRWNPNISPDGAIELGLYSHINHGDDNPCPDRNGEHSINLGAFISKAELDQADDDETFVGPEVELIFYSKGFYVRVGNRGAAIRRDFTLEADPLPLPQKNDYLEIWECPFLGTNQCETKIRRDIFFGGDERAPHDIYVHSTGWCVDCGSTWWSQTDTKLYGSSRWYSGDVQTIGASQLIRIGVNVEPQPNSEQITTFFNGANITFVTPNAEHDVTPVWVWDDEVAGTGHWNSTIVDAEVGAEIDFLASNVISNSGEVFDWICPVTQKWNGINNTSTENTDNDPGNSDDNYKNQNLKNQAPLNQYAPSSGNSIIITPNPTTGRTVIYFSPEQITSATARLEITDIVGQKVFEKNPFAQGVNNYIDLSHLQKGVYFLKISTQDEVRVEKVVIE